MLIPAGSKRTVTLVGGQRLLFPDDCIDGLAVQVQPRDLVAADILDPAHGDRQAVAAASDPHVFGAHAKFDLARLACVTVPKRHLAPRDNRVIPLERGRQQVHARRADEIAHEGMLGRSNNSSGVPICTTRPSYITTTLSAKVNASVWSWVT